MAMGRLVTGLDIGTTKITTVIAAVREDDQVDVIGTGQVASRGLERGMVVNLEETVNSISESVQQAEQIAGVKVERAYVGLAGEHIRGITTNAAVSVSRENNEIAEDDVYRVMQHAQAINIPQDLEIIHVFPQGYVVNGVEHVRNPVGLSGNRLEGEIYIVLSSATAVQNIERAVQRAGIQVCEIVLQPLASSLSVLTPDEKDLGVAMLDVGGGTTDIAVFVRGAIKHAAVVGLGGSNVTSDIAIGLTVPMSEAERLKHEHGCALMDMLEGEEEILPLTGLGGRSPEPIELDFLTDVIESRLEEIFEFAWQEVEQAGLDKQLAGGVVLTGGGAMVRGAAELARRIFGLPVKLGVPQGVVGLTESVLTPMNATGIGLVLYGASQESSQPSMQDNDEELAGDANPFGAAVRWMKDFFAGQ